MLGAAGCKWTAEDIFCCYITKIKDRGFYCLKYRVYLEKHHSGEPFRAKQCGDAANKKK